jgi:predicted DNA-binding protein
MNKDQMIIRLDKNLKEKLNKLARAEGKNSSQVVRELITGYIQDRDIGFYVEDLWTRMKKKFKEKNISPDKIRKAIRDSRKAS